MGKCTYCGERIFFGATKKDGLHYCDDECLEKDTLLKSMQDSISVFDVEKLALEIFGGICPLCKKSGRSVDIFYSHTVLSYIWGTRWRTVEHVCCRSCARKKQMTHMLSSFFLGWWGLPWGVLITPVQVFKNLTAFLKVHSSMTPSDLLKERARILLVQEKINNPQEEEDDPFDKGFRG